MQAIKIPRSLLKHGQQFLRNNDKFDLLGSILFELGENIPDKSRLPSDLKKEIAFFTFSQRRRIIDSKITLDIVALDASPQEIAVRKANEILKGLFTITVL